MSSFLVCRTRITGSFQLILFTAYVSIKLSKSKSSSLYPYQLNQSGLGLGFGLALCYMCEIDRPRQKERQPCHLYYSVCWEFSCWAVWIKTFRYVLNPLKKLTWSPNPLLRTDWAKSLLTHMYFEAIGHLLQGNRASQQCSSHRTHNHCPHKMNNSSFWPCFDSRKVSTSLIPVQWGHSHLQRFIAKKKLLPPPPNTLILDLPVHTFLNLYDSHTTVVTIKVPPCLHKGRDPSTKHPQGG